MASLPFVVQPRLKPIIETIGDENIGTIQIERRGYLSAGEKNFLAAQFNSEDVTRKTLSLVRKIASKLKVSQEDAYEELQYALTGDSANPLIEKNFSNDISELGAAIVDSNTRRQLVTAYCMIIYRVDSDVEFHDFLELHTDIVEGLAKLYDEEDAKTIDRLIDANTKAEVSQENTAENLEKK